MPAIEPSKPKPSAAEIDAAVRRREQMRSRDVRRNAAVSKIAGDVLHLFGKRPDVADPERRRLASESLLFFLCEASYFPDSVGRSPLCDEQIAMADRLEHCINTGAPSVHAGFRGSIKSAVHELAALWALLTGRRRFLGWYGCTGKVAKSGVRSLAMELEENDRLALDWPDACWLFRALEGNDAKCRNQRYGGEPTHIKCSTTELVIPFVDDAGRVDRWACVTAKGLNAQDAARALRWKTPHGENLRPDMAVVDDPQSRRSAMSGTQIYDRLKLITDDVANSGSTDTTFALAVCGNVIQVGDVMDKLLDANEFPHWSGDRIARLKHWPKERDGLWQKYADIRRDFDRSIPGDRQRAIDAANKFYLANQAAMDSGGVATWEHAYKRGQEFNALHSSMNAWVDMGDATFAAECQQRPMGSDVDGVDQLQIPPYVFADKRTNRDQGVCPAGTEAITVGVDVQQDCLFFLAVAWAGDGSGSVIDYGAWPDQKIVMFNLRSLRLTLRQQYPGRDIPGAIRAGVDELRETLLDRDWKDTAGHSIPVAKILVDTGFETDTIYAACEQSGHPTVVIPCHGKGIGPKQKPFGEYRPETGQKLGDNWRWKRPTGRALRAIEIDTNFWKTALHRRLQIGKGDVGALTIFGNSQFPHNLLEAHLQAEIATRKEDGRIVYVWDLQKNKPDNHLLDCLVMAMVGASFGGIGASGRRDAPEQTAEDVDVVDLARQKGFTVQSGVWQ